MERFADLTDPFIVWEGSGLIAVAKPAGMHSAPLGASVQGSLAEWLFRQRPAFAVVNGHKRGEGGLLHRLDRATAGLVLFAGSDAIFQCMSELAATDRFEKLYSALAVPGCGGLSGSHPLLQVPDGCDRAVWEACLRRRDVAVLARLLQGSAVESHFRPYGPGSRRVACSCKPGRHKAWTADSYRTDIISARAEAGSLALVIRLSRGFRHQIRAHCAWLGLALSGDPVYGDGPDEHGTMGRSTGVDAPDASSPAWHPGHHGLCLLAHALRFPDPATGRILTITLPIIAEQA
jgi:23S rRNA pseudouridine1911/1915/1917 synthase